MSDKVLISQENLCQRHQLLRLVGERKPHFRARPAGGRAPSMTLIDALLRLLPWLAFFLAVVIGANIIAGWR